jgi:hypothetical protein
MTKKERKSESAGNASVVNSTSRQGAADIDTTRLPLYWGRINIAMMRNKNETFIQTI